MCNYSNNPINILSLQIYILDLDLRCYIWKVIQLYMEMEQSNF